DKRSLEEKPYPVSYLCDNPFSSWIFLDVLWTIG
ncbi:unnamed protein product, partial [marine sediment metagenome]